MNDHECKIITSINLTGEVSIFQADLKAIQEAAKHLNTHENTQGLYIKFFSDSQAALQALKSNNCKAQAVIDTNDTLNALADQAKLVHLTGIKAHIPLDENELADKYAKLGTVDFTTKIKTQTTYKVIKAATREYVYHKWKAKYKKPLKNAG